MDKDYLLNYVLKDCDFTGKFSQNNYEERIILPRSFECELFSGVSKVCIVPYDEDYVIKIPFNYSSFYDVYDEEYYNPLINANADNRFCWDYCLSELLNYRKAKQEGVSKFFCKIRLLGYIHDYPIYIQQYATPFFMAKGEYDLHLSKRIRNYCVEKHFICFNYIWQADAIKYYGEHNFDRLMKFLKKHGIEDLHSENIGYAMNGAPVIFDFSDYKEY